MKGFNWNKYFFFAALLLLCCSASAQTTSSSTDYKKYPVWISMMKDTSVNFFETVKAFKEFFSERALPKEPNEIEGEESFEMEVGLEEHEGKKKSKKELRREAKKLKPNEPNYAADVRAFKGWFYGIRPWVREDGSIIGPKEQQAIIDRQRNELKETEKANGKN